MNKTAKPFRQRIMHCLALLLAVSSLYGCGGVGADRASSPTSRPSQSLSVTVSPLAADLRTGDTQQFSATVSGSVPATVGPTFLPASAKTAFADRPEGTHPGPIRPGPATQKVIWSINGVPGGNAGVGTIDAKGLYTSPTILPTPNAIEVTAASAADPSVSETALLTLYNPVPAVTVVTPAKIEVGAFSLTVSGRSFVQGAQVSFGGIPLKTTFNSSSKLIATGSASQTQVGNTQVLVTNPEPGSARSAALNVQVVPKPVTAPPTPPQPGTPPSTTWNPAVLGVPWASDFTSIAANQIDVKKDPRLKINAKGDGVTDDTSAIRAAIQLASSSGGGTVYFPAGQYMIVTPSNPSRGSPLVIPSRVILRGAGLTATRLLVKDPSADSQTDWIGTWAGISFHGSSLSGMTDLGIQALNASSSPCALLWNRGTNKVSKLFFNNLDILLENCRTFWFEATDNLLVQNSHFDGNSSRNGPIYVVGNSHVSFLGNKITYNFGRVQLQNNTNMLMQHNTLVRDAHNKDTESKTAIESGGVEISFGQNIQVLNNTIQTLNAPPGESGDGEAIMSQQATTPTVLDAGSVTAATATTLTDTNALWGPITEQRLAKYPEVVAILTGSRTGEWRTIQGVTTANKTLTLNQPWTSLPEVGSLYSIFAWTLMDANIQNNKLIDNPNGIVLWDGCYNCTVRDNTLTNSRGIILRAVDESLNPSLYPEGRRVHHVAIKSKISNNRISNPSGLRPAYVALDIEAFEKHSYRGMGMIDIQVSGNVLEPYSTNPNHTYGTAQLSQEGFFPCFLFGPAAVKDPVNRVFQNISFSNNSQTTTITYGPYFSSYATTRACVNAPKP